MLRKEFMASDIKQSFLESGNGDEFVLFIHGNGSSSLFWKQLMQSIPEKYTCIAPDLRGYGETEAVPAEAKNSFGDFVKDLVGLMKAQNASKFHVVSHSLGGGISWELVCTVPDSILSVTMVNPASPFGFGGTKNENGELTFPDAAGSGGGIVNPDFVKLLEKQDRTESNISSPLNVMNAFYWNPDFKPHNTEELLDSLLSMKVGNSFYPGDHTASPNFPFVAPGKYGQLNCAAPFGKAENVEKLLKLEHKPPILWIRGGKDQIVSNTSMFDTSTHGITGFIPEYPGEEICPQQPMVDQTRFVLKNYQSQGGKYKEVLYEESGHSPFLEEPERFLSELMNWFSVN
jgi:pimeloyl-ACP methyl ester carboxylesterase